MALRAVPDHPKFAHLKSLLGLPKGAALGYLECIWHFAARFTPRGNIGKYADTAIESWVEWNGEPGALIRAMVESGWLYKNDEFRLVVHDWSQHTDEVVNTTLARNCEMFWDGTLPKTGRLNQHEREKFRQWSATFSHQSASLPTNSASTPKPVPEPIPVPDIPPLPPKGGSAASVPDAVYKLAAETFDLSDNERQAELSKANGSGKQSLLNPEVETVLDQVARRIHGRHPAIRRCGPGEAKKQLRLIARKAPAAKRIEVLHQIDQNHAGWCESEGWRKDGGQYAKGLDNWLAPTKERWKERPPAAPEAPDDGYISYEEAARRRQSEPLLGEVM